ncbi:hypothetical protein [Flammeovirga aprica]|uniref:Uncharacterized protein n=1 Tax=Flammeovirga aprica JL-4 TaxID=694437 RepID=A0A7X9RZG5_9BACT|nr:hypothetical protein [Flammeovirga aprica]NME71543.1 hypothetical protein [Flammeovirga aprica JL-4]
MQIREKEQRLEQKKKSNTNYDGNYNTEPQNLEEANQYYDNLIKERNGESEVYVEPEGKVKSISNTNDKHPTSTRKAGHFILYIRKEGIFLELITPIKGAKMILN